MTEALNYRKGSSLKGLIKQQTNPKGIIRDTVLQRVVMNSLSDGALRLYAGEDRHLLEQGVSMMSESTTPFSTSSQRTGLVSPPRHRGWSTAPVSSRSAM